MDKIRQYFRSSNMALLWVACLAVVSGGMYYLLFRWQGSYLASHWVGFDSIRRSLSDPTGGALPSLLHMLALGCMAAALLGARNGAKLTIGLLLMTLLAERAVGVFDWADVYFAVTGCLLALVLATQCQKQPQSKMVSRKQAAFASAALVACSSLFIAATVPCIYCGPAYEDSRPVYLSYIELRNAVSVDPPREVNDVSRVYLYQTYILLNKRNQGIHVLDNSDPGNPVNKLFISIPGNTEISIRNNYLYADSYIDLVTLNLNDPENIQEVSRQEGVFPWDEYQNVPNDIYFGYGDIDVTRGVVVGYER